jgi:putative addiction module component (TIGR02574 family)
MTTRTQLSPEAEALKPALMNLNESDRIGLLEFLNDQTPAYWDDLDDQQMQELNRRSDEIDRGVAKGRPVDEVLREYRTRGV